MADVCRYQRLAVSPWRRHKIGIGSYILCMIQPCYFVRIPSFFGFGLMMLGGKIVFQERCMSFIYMGRHGAKER